MTAFKYLTIEKQASNQVIELLEQNRIGTPGESMVYKLTDVPGKITSVPAPTFASMYIRDRLYGTICFSKRSVYSMGEKHTAYYLRYFTFRDQVRSSSPGKPGRSGKSSIAAEVHRVMQGEGFADAPQPYLYAYVDPENVRSKRLIDEFGFVPAGDFRTISFSRIAPRCHSNVEKVEESQLDSIKELLLAFYENDRLVLFEYLKAQGSYFVVKENDRIVCGVQAIEDRWEILDIPGIKGAIMMRLAPHLPLIRKLFNPDFRFVFFEHIFCLPGREKMLGRLFESVLAQSKLNSAIICLDPRSKAYNSVRQVGLGLTHKLMGEKKIEIYVKTNDLKHRKTNVPFFISGFDVL